MPHHTSYRVYYEDTDAGGVVYYANYLAFAERARTEYLRSYNINQSDLLQQNIAFVVRRIDASYISPAKLDDMLDIDTVISRKTAATIEFEQNISVSGKESFILKCQIVCVDTEKFKPIKIPNIFESI